MNADERARVRRTAENALRGARAATARERAKTEAFAAARITRYQSQHVSLEAETAANIDSQPEA